jgi:hypothetical protein
VEIARHRIGDNIDKLYGNTSGTTAPTTPPAEGGEFGADLGGAPPAGGELPPAEGETAITPESVKKNMNILLERDNVYGVEEIDLERGRRSLGIIEEQLGKLID